MKLISWNLNGVRAVAKKGLIDMIYDMNPDIIGFQETKAQDDQVREALFGLEGYHIYANSAEKKGYSGTAILTKIEPLSIFLVNPQLLHLKKPILFRFLNNL